MSKIINSYNKLKLENPNVLYLFKCGAFYIAVQDDAMLLCETFDFKLTDFGKSAVKCGFPISRLEHYKSLLTIKAIVFSVIEGTLGSSPSKNKVCTNHKNDAEKAFITRIAQLEIYNLTPLEAITILDKIRTEAKLLC